MAEQKNPDYITNSRGMIVNPNRIIGAYCERVKQYKVIGAQHCEQVGSYVELRLKLGPKLIDYTVEGDYPNESLCNARINQIVATWSIPKN